MRCLKKIKTVVCKRFFWAMCWLAFSFYGVLFDCFCMNISALIEWIVLYKPECTYYIIHRLLIDYYGINHSHSVFRCVHVSATKYVYTREGLVKEMLAKRNINFFLSFFFVLIFFLVIIILD